MCYNPYRNPENQHVGIVVFCSDTSIKIGDLFQCIVSIVNVPAGRYVYGTFQILDHSNVAFFLFLGV